MTRKSRSKIFSSYSVKSIGIMKEEQKEEIRQDDRGNVTLTNRRSIEQKFDLS